MTDTLKAHTCTEGDPCTEETWCPEAQGFIEARLNKQRTSDALFTPVQQALSAIVDLDAKTRTEGASPRSLALRRAGDIAEAALRENWTNEAKDLEKAFAEDASNVESILLHEVVRAARKAMAHHCSSNDRKHDRTWKALDEVLDLVEARQRTDKAKLDPWAEKFYAAFQTWACADEDGGEEAEAEIACWALRDQYEAHRETLLRTETALPEEKKR